MSHIVVSTVSADDLASLGARVFSGTMIKFRLGLGLQGLYSATNCADNIPGRFTIILQNQIVRVDSFTNLTKR